MDQPPPRGQQPFDQDAWRRSDWPTEPIPAPAAQAQGKLRLPQQPGTLWQRYRRSRRAQIGSVGIGLLLVGLLIAASLAFLPELHHSQTVPAPIALTPITPNALTPITPNALTPLAPTAAFPANIELDAHAPYGSYEQSNLTNPNIGAVDINANWAEVEPQQGVLNWKPADDEMAAWSTHGKKFTLIIRYVHQQLRSSCAVGKQWLPAWEAAKIPTLCTAGGDTLPDYFDATFKSDLKAYLTAIAQHLAASAYKSNLAYVRMGVGMEGEGYPCLHCSSADWQQLAAWGYSTTAWAQWQKAMLTSLKGSFSVLPAVPLIYPLGNNEIDPAAHQPVSQEVAYWAAAQGFGVGQQGLINSSGYAKGLAVRIMTYVKSQYPSAYLQFQTLTAVQSAGEVQADIAIAGDARASSIEWFAQDSINPAYQPYFQQWQKMVDSQSAAR
jgi:hypothetical protein